VGKAGTHCSTCRATEEWAPACAGERLRGRRCSNCGPIANGATRICRRMRRMRGSAPMSARSARIASRRTCTMSAELRRRVREAADPPASRAPAGRRTGASAGLDPAPQAQIRPCRHRRVLGVDEGHSAGGAVIFPPLPGESRDPFLILSGCGSLDPGLRRDDMTRVRAARLVRSLRPVRALPCSGLRSSRLLCRRACRGRRGI
jgi:hypothetical protein